MPTRRGLCIDIWMYCLCIDIIINNRSLTNNHKNLPLITSDEQGHRPTINSNSLPTVDYLGRVTQLGH